MENKGVSLVELIVVIAILAILSGTTVGVVTYQNQSDVGQCVRKLNSVLSKVRSETIAKKDKVYLHLYKKDDAYYMQTTTNYPADTGKKATKIANAKVKVNYRTNDGASDANSEWKELTEDAGPIAITFQKSTGAFYRVDEAGGNRIFYPEIEFSNKSNRKTLYLVEGTGRHYVK